MGEEFKDKNLKIPKKYFLECLTIYKKSELASGIIIIERASLPKDIFAIGAQVIKKIWREHKVCGSDVSIYRVKNIV